jgi:hypothetical protein
MSQKEFEQQDAQVIGMVNHTPVKSEPSHKEQAEMGSTEEAYTQRRILWTVIRVLSCILVAAIFVAALLDPRIVVHLVNIGVLTCGIVAAIVIDRHLRGM